LAVVLFLDADTQQFFAGGAFLKHDGGFWPDGHGQTPLIQAWACARRPDIVFHPWSLSFDDHNLPPVVSAFVLCCAMVSDRRREQPAGVRPTEPAQDIWDHSGGPRRF